MIRIGDLFLLALPGEFTTMSGRRIRAQITATLKANGIANPVVVLCGPSNTYTHYITTYEEYQAQRYEAASTIYGPHTLSAYLQQYEILVQAMIQGEKMPA